MPVPAVRLVLVVALTLAGSGVAGRQSPPLIVHEWGTFTTVAGQNGQAIEWLPLGGPQDLPCFVYHFDNNSLIKWSPTPDPPLTYDRARSAMRGTVRMETPVLYFYSSEAVSADVSVSFPQGLMTEWYPKAAVFQPPASATALRNWNQSLLRWRHVAVRPNVAPSLPTEPAPSHYYAARATDASPIQVAGEAEKFLFYRGVGGFQPPISATAAGDGSVRLENLGEPDVPGVVLFENRGGRIGYRIHGTLGRRATLEAPALTRDVAALHRGMERMLVASGLYVKEAKAMIETWRDSWFEEGARVFYIVPGPFVDATLPLSVAPAPASVVRTFVGRVEVMTPATLATVAEAIAEGDDAALVAYGRFLEPITDRILSRATPSDRARIQASVNDTYRRYVERLTARCQ